MAKRSSRGTRRERKMKHEAAFNRADRSIQRTADAISAAVDKLLDGLPPEVARDYAIERLIVTLVDGDTQIMRWLDGKFRGAAGTKLSYALTEWIVNSVER
jgi:actin-like ATPase involved in cell morphogenesis